MARVLFTLLLLVVFTTLRVYGAPAQDGESPKLNRQRRTFGFSILGGRDWEEFRRWPFVTLTPPMKNMMSMFEEESSKESLIKRLEALEHGHKRIIEYLKKMQDTTSANKCRPSSAEAPAEKLPEPVSVFAQESTAVPKIDVRVQTDAPAQPTTQAPTTAEVTTPGVKDKVEPPTTTKIATAEVEGKVVPITTGKTTTVEVEDKEVTPAPAKIASAEVEHKVVPLEPTKIASAEVEDKVVPLAPTKIASAEVEDKAVPQAPTKMTPAEVEDKVVPTTTKITSGEVEDKVVPTTTKITSGEVEDKSESSTPAKIASAEVEDKVEPTARPQEVSSSEESKEKVSNEKIETSLVDAEVPATTAMSEAVADSNQETTTQFEETNDINDILI